MRVDAPMSRRHFLFEFRRILKVVGRLCDIGSLKHISWYLFALEAVGTIKALSCGRTLGRFLKNLDKPISLMIELLSWTASRV